MKTQLLPRVQRNLCFRLWPKRTLFLAGAAPWQTGSGFSWLWWHFVVVLPDCYR